MVKRLLLALLFLAAAAVTYVAIDQAVGYVNPARAEAVAAAPRPSKGECARLVANLTAHARGWIQAPPALKNAVERKVAACLRGRRMSAGVRRCLVAAGVSVGGAVVGGVIGAAAARAIAGGVIGGGATACLSSLFD